MELLHAIFPIHICFSPIDQHTKIVNVCAPYTEFKVRWTFFKEPFSVELMYISYLLQSDIRKNIMKKSFSFSNINYYDGVAACNFPHSHMPQALEKLLLNQSDTKLR